MDCCGHNQALNQIFDEQNARQQVRDYLRRGLDRHSRAMLRALGADGLSGAALLEIGGGIGALHLELLKRGAASAVDVDVSAGYVRAAQELAETLGLRDRVTYQVADFTRSAASWPAADVVLMHRVVCCYPDLPGLLGAAAAHAGRRLVLSYPTVAWYTRLFRLLANGWMRLSRSAFRLYLHAPAAIQSAAQAGGLRLARRRSSWPWQIAVFER